MDDQTPLQRAKDYVKQHRQQGWSDQQIRQRLAATGWAAATIRELWQALDDDVLVVELDDEDEPLDVSVGRASEQTAIRWIYHPDDEHLPLSVPVEFFVAADRGLVRELDTWFRRECADTNYDISHPLEDILADVEWSWPWLEQWHQYFARIGYFPYMWREAGYPDRVNKWSQGKLLQHTVVKAMYTANDIQRYRDACIPAFTILQADTDNPCPACEPHGDNIPYPLSELPTHTPPFHPGCRCTTIGVLDD